MVQPPNMIKRLIARAGRDSSRVVVVAAVLFAWGLDNCTGCAAKQPQQSDDSIPPSDMVPYNGPMREGRYHVCNYDEMTDSICQDRT